MSKDGTTSEGSSAASADPSWVWAAWTWARDYWHWPVLVGVGVYLYLQLFPSVDLTQRSEPAPSFSAQTLDGETFSMDANRGEVVVVNVWGTWCPPCRVEMPGFQDVHAALKDDGVQFVGIAVNQQGPDEVRAYVAEEGVTFPQIVSSRIAARYFPGTTVPRTYLIDAEGHIRYRHTGLWMASSLRDAIEQLQAESSAP